MTLTKIQTIASGTGATIRTIDSKLQDVVSVKDFGAKGDNNTDDSAAIQAAHDSLSSGGTLFFPAGTYRANVVLTKDNVNLMGTGKASVIAPTSGRCIFISAIDQGNGGVVSGLTLSGVNGATEGCRVEGFSRGCLENLYITAINTGINIDGDKSTETFFRDIYFYNINTTAVNYFRTDGVDTGGVYFYNLHHTGTNTSTSFSFTSSHSSRTRAFAFIDNCILDNRNTYAIYCQNTTNFWVNNSWMTGTSNGKGLLTFDGSKQLQMNNTFVQNSHASGYNVNLLNNIEDLQFDGCRFSGAGEDIHYAGNYTNGARVSMTDCIFTSSVQASNNTTRLGIHSGARVIAPNGQAYSISVNNSGNIVNTAV